MNPGEWESKEFWHHLNKGNQDPVLTLISKATEQLTGVNWKESTRIS